MAPQMVIVYPLTTTVTISSFPTPFPTELAAFIPHYNARADGSLITPRYMREIKDANVRILVVGFLLMFFLRNAIVSIEYLYRSRSKDKSLFYLLVASQVLGPVYFISLAISHLSASGHCTAIYVVALLAIAISQSILITGILGIKAYRCLDRSRIVLAVISTLQIASTAVLCYEVTRLRSQRLPSVPRSSGSCQLTSSTGSLGFVPFCIIILFLQSFFICLCFSYTVWKASTYSAAQGRLSLAVSLETVTDPRARSVSPAAADIHESRGRWDLMSHSNGSGVPRGSDAGHHFSGDPSRPTGIPQKPLPSIIPPKLTVVSEKPLPQPQRSAVRLPDPPRTTSPVMSFQQRWGGRISRLRFVRVAMRDELIHAATIALNSIITLTLMIVGIFHPVERWGGMMILGINWMLTSVVVMHSFSRVVQRHEREAILREPATWALMARHESRPQAPSLTSISPRRHRGNIEPGGSFNIAGHHRWSDPFRSPEDIEALQSNGGYTAESAISWNLDTSSAPPTPRPNFLPNFYPSRADPQPLPSPSR